MKQITYNISENKKSRGSVLLLSLLVLAVIMAGSVALGSIVISEIRRARNIDNSIVAYYAAESGVEESLYRIRKNDEAISGLVSAEKNFLNGAFWSMKDIKDTEANLEYDLLPENKFIEFDVYKTEGVENDIKTLLVSGDGDGLERLEISWFGFSGGISENPLSEFKQKEYSHSVIFYDPENGHRGAIVNLTEGIGDYDFYRVKVKSLYGDVGNLIITAYADPAATEPAGGLPLPARVTATLAGEFHNTRQILRYAMPRQSPLGGLFDFVLFSECSILKGLSEDCL